MNTSQIKVYEERNSEYGLGDELHFHIPQTVLMINPLETFLKFNIVSGSAGAGTITAGEVDVDHYYKLILNPHIGASALIKELTISTGNGSVVLEQFDNYNKLKNIICRFTDNESEKNKKRLFEGAGELQATKEALLYDNNDGVNDTPLNNRKIEVCVPLRLSGILNNNQPFPSYLTGGLRIRILLEHEFSKVFNSASIAPVWNPSAKNIQNRQCGIGINDSGFRTDPATILNGAAVASVNLANSLAEANQASGVGLPANDPNQQLGSLGFVSDSATSIFNHPFCKGQTLVISGLSSAGPPAAPIPDVEAVIASIENDAGRLKINFVNNVNVGANVSDVVRVYIKNTATNPNIVVSDMELIVGTVSPSPKQLEGLERAVSSKGYAFDYTTYRDYMINNSANEIVVSNTIISKVRRARAIMSNWEVLDTHKLGSDNLSGSVQANQNPKDYQYILNNLLTPNQKVSLSEYIRTRNEQIGWSAIHIKELEDAFEAVGMKVEDLTDLDGCLVISRALGKYGHTMNLAQAQGELRLNVNWNSNTTPLLYHNWVSHIRTVVINKSGVQVLM